MTDLLIHSMAEFSELIQTVLDLADARNVVQIGAEPGGMSLPLADYCARHGGNLIAVEPEPTPEFVAWTRTQPHVRHVAAPSLDVIGTLSHIDAWLIDGDHNYFTVYHELLEADALAQRDGRPLLAVLHDVSWPCSRRDMYRAPDRIPDEFRHPFSHHVGVTPGNPGSLFRRGFRSSGQFAWALRAGGPRNGVLTAVEDFCRASEIGDRRLFYVHVPVVFGLGVLFDAAAPWAEAVALEVMPFHESTLLANMELNRLNTYLAMLDWQDGFLSRA